MGDLDQAQASMPVAASTPLSSLSLSIAALYARCPQDILLCNQKHPIVPLIPEPGVY
jgi:hypothetical protein